MRDRKAKRIGLAIIGAGRVGLFRGEVAARHPQVDWIGIAEIKPERAKLVADKVGADFVTDDYRKLLNRSEVTAVIISTDEHLHVDPILAACEHKYSLMIEKPLATDLADSARLTTAALVRVSARITSGPVGTGFRAGVDWDRPGRTRQTSDGACQALLIRS